MKKLFLLCFLIALINFNLFAQDKGKQQNNAPSFLKAPASTVTDNNNPDPNVQSYMSRFFGVGLNGTVGASKSFLNTPSTLTLLSSTARSIFGGALDATGTWYGLEYLAAGSGNLVKIDTSNGTYVTIGALTGLSTGHTVTGMSWNKINSTMYALSTDGVSGSLYTINLATAAMTFIGSTTGSTLPIDMSFNSMGILYSVDIGTDALNTLNITTGAATTVGPLGVDLNYAQGMAFDISTDSLFLAAYNLTLSAGQLMRCNTSTGAATLIGNLGSVATEYDGFVIPGGAANQLSPFNLVSPTAGARVVTVAGSATPVVISWDTSASGARYNWVFGNPIVPPRRLTIPATTNSITTTLGALDAILAANGFTNNGSATDSAVGQWNVWAYKGSGAPGPDSLASTNGPRAITLKRQQVTLTPFALLSPPTNITLVTSPVDPSPVNITWNRSGSGANYKWLFKVGATYSDPATLSLASNNSGLDSVLTLRNSQIDSVLSGLGVAPGDSVTGQWRVRSYATGDSLNSNAPDRTITFRRVGLLPLNQSFTDPTFPPPFWGLDAGGGTQYWTRNAASGYQVGVGSAKYDYWSAVTTTPLQTLTSNQFPPVIAPNNYLKFDYSQAFYLSGTTLAPDSCIIETSTNNGATWTRLIGMGSSQTLSSGTNSNGIMSTVGGPFSGAFTPTLASQWASKVFMMPEGTNKVRFVGKSGYGNNLYIDNITSGGLVGVGNDLTLIPDSYKLDQNYPNPFNPVTTINFSLPKSSKVSLKIYNVLGKEVSTLINESKPAGRYEISFDASSLSSGVYFYRIEADNFSDIKRMMLIK